MVIFYYFLPYVTVVYVCYVDFRIFSADMKQIDLKALFEHRMQEKKLTAQEANSQVNFCC